MSRIDEDLAAAVAHIQAGQWGEAEGLLRAIMQQDPHHPEALLYLGILAGMAGRLQEAIDLMSRASSLRPDHPGFFLNLGQTYLKAGRNQDALTSFQHALELNPAIADAHEYVGFLSLKEKRTEEAIASLQKAVDLEPGRATAHNLLGTALAEAGRHEEAVQAFERALGLEAHFADAHYNLGVVRHDTGQWEKAFASLDQAFSLLPPGAKKLKAGLFLPEIMHSPEAIRRTRQRVRQNLEFLARTPFTLENLEKTIDWLPFFLAYHGENEKETQKQIALLFQQKIPSLNFTAWHCQMGQAPSAPIKVGFISRHFHNHTIGQLNAGFIRNLSRDRFRTILFRFQGNEDHPFSEFIRQSADLTVTLAEDLATARSQIANQELDVLYYPDVGMDMLTYLLAFSRLAPVQCVSWGHPVTSGIPSLDYFLSSRDMEPPGAEEHYSERLVAFPHVNVFYYRPRLSEPARTRKHFGLKDEHHLYLCPQSLFKIHPDFDEILGGILRSDRRGLVVFPEGDQAHWRRLLRNRFEKTLADVHGRIRFFRRLPLGDFLHFQAVADVMLDPLHFGGGNTSFQGLAVGLPIVTLPGKFLRSRLTYAMYRQMGLEDCIASNVQDYIQRAVRLGTDRDYRQAVGEKILEHNGVLFENPQSVRELEEFLIAAVESARR